MRTPITPERLAEIREKHEVSLLCWGDIDANQTTGELLGEVERLREELIRCQDKNLDLLEEDQRNADIVADAHRLKPEYDKLRDWQRRAVILISSLRSTEEERDLGLEEGEIQEMDDLLTDTEAEAAMTDETPIPCAWCGKEPRSKPTMADPTNLRYECRTDGCFENYGFTLWEWNAKQRRILAQRKADFEAGVLRAAAFKSEIVDEGLLPSESLERLANDYLARGGE